MYLRVIFFVVFSIMASLSVMGEDSNVVNSAVGKLMDNKLDTEFYKTKDINNIGVIVSDSLYDDNDKNNSIIPISLHSSVEIENDISGDISVVGIDDDIKYELVDMLSHVEVKLYNKRDLKPVYIYRDIDITSEDLEILYKITQAEASGQGRQGKVLVANVILNRAVDDSFPDTIEEVVFSGNGAQFSPVRNGSFDSAVPDKETMEAVNAAIEGEDYSSGALFFCNEKTSSPKNVQWFNSEKTKLFVYNQHSFFK